MDFDNSIYDRITRESYRSITFLSHAHWLNFRISKCCKYYSLPAEYYPFRLRYLANTTLRIRIITLCQVLINCMYLLLIETLVMYDLLTYPRSDAKSLSTTHLLLIANLSTFQFQYQMIPMIFANQSYHMKCWIKYRPIFIHSLL